jgi:hypothetical protein
MRFAVFPFDYLFRGGSRIRLVIDTPSQTGGWNFEPLANAGVNSILHDSEHPSEITFGTVPGATTSAGYPACDTLLNQPCRPDAFTASNPPGQLKFSNVPASTGGSPPGCIDRRRFAFHLHGLPGQPVVRATIYINGHRVRRVRGHRLTSLVLRALPKGRFVVRIVTVTDRGNRVVSVRRYIGCTKTPPHTVVQHTRH